MLATADDVRRYVDAPDGPALDIAIDDADMWVRERVSWRHVERGRRPAPVVEAAALLAAVFHDEPSAITHEDAIPNMVRLMLVPYS